MELYFATSNPGKVDDAQAIFADADRDITVQQADVDLVEPCLDTLEAIAAAKASQAVEQTQLFGAHVMVDDSGLFVDALNGFPGQHTAFFDDTAGKERLLWLLDDTDDRTARFRAAVAVYSPETGEYETFTGECVGELVEPRGSDGFGYDPLFLPENHDKTFAEDTDYKQQVSHRREALEKVKKWFNARDGR